MEKIIYEGIEFAIPNKVERIAKYHGVTHTAVKNGTLERMPCEICGNEKTDAHHEVYASKKYKIRWLCHKHHAKIHYLFHEALGVKHWTIRRRELIISLGYDLSLPIWFARGPHKNKYYNETLSK